MNTQKTIGLVCLVLALGVIGYWLASGAHAFTQTKVAVQTQVSDDVFGDTTTTTEWRDEFRPGIEYAGPTAAVLLIAAGGLMWSASRKRRSTMR